MACFTYTPIKKITDDYATSVRQSMTDRGDALPFGDETTADALPFGDETTAACWK